jgi:catechol-2,3-dioxygenase
MARPVISEVGHVALRVLDAAACVAQDTSLFGLRVTEDAGERVSVTHGAPHHSVEYIRSEENALDHIGLVAADDEALGEIRGRVEKAGYDVVADSPLDAHISDGFAFAVPDGFVFEIYRGMKQSQAGPHGLGIRPRRFGHVNLTAGDPEALRHMLEAVLDFRVSDFVGSGCFLRCNAEHHGIGVFPGPPGIHHYAFEVPHLTDLANLADVVAESGGEMLWGPARHPVGHNISTYVLAPSNVIVEYYVDMDHIYDEASHSPGRMEIDESHRWFNIWNPHLPDLEGYFQRGAPVARR